MKAGSVVIFESTMRPGCTEEVCVAVLKEFSGPNFNREFFCGCSPERINPGDNVNTLAKIRKITSSSTPGVAKAVDAPYASSITASTFPATSLKVTGVASSRWNFLPFPSGMASAHHSGVKAVVSDPWADADEVARAYGIQLGAIDAVHPVDTLVVAVARNEFRRQHVARLRSLCHGDKRVVADLKCLFDRHTAADAGFTVFRL